MSNKSFSPTSSPVPLGSKVFTKNTSDSSGVENLSTNTSTQSSEIVSVQIPQKKRDARPKRETHIAISPHIRKTTLEDLDKIAHNLGYSRNELLEILCDNYVETIRKNQPELLGES